MKTQLFDISEKMLLCRLLWIINLMFEISLRFAGNVHPSSEMKLTDRTGNHDNSSRSVCSNFHISPSLRVKDISHPILCCSYESFHSLARV